MLESIGTSVQTLYGFDDMKMVGDGVCSGELSDMVQFANPLMCGMFSVLFHATRGEINMKKRPETRYEIMKELQRLYDAFFYLPLNIAYLKGLVKYIWFIRDTPILLSIIKESLDGSKIFARLSNIVSKFLEILRGITPLISSEEKTDRFYSLAKEIKDIKDEVESNDLARNLHKVFFSKLSETGAGSQYEANKTAEYEIITVPTDQGDLIVNTRGTTDFNGVFQSYNPDGKLFKTILTYARNPDVPIPYEKTMSSDKKIHTSARDTTYGRIRDIKKGFGILPKKSGKNANKDIIYPVKNFGHILRTRRPEKSGLDQP